MPRQAFPNCSLNYSSSQGSDTALEGISYCKKKLSILQANWKTKIKDITLLNFDSVSKQAKKFPSSSHKDDIKCITSKDKPKKKGCSNYSFI